MINELVSREFDLLAYKRKFYRIPVEVTKIIPSELAAIPEIKKRSEEIARELGLEKDKEKGYTCENCEYQSDNGCGRKLNKDEPQMLSYFFEEKGMFWFDKETTEFVARHAGIISGYKTLGPPCPAYAGLIIALIEHRKFDEFLIEEPDLDIEMFPSIYEISPGKGKVNTELQKKARELYQQLSK